MITFDGSRDLTPPPADVWTLVSDARFLAGCIPGIESMTRAEPGEVVCTIRPGFSFARGILEITVRVEVAIPSTSVRLAIHSKGIGSTSDVAATMMLAPQGTGTRVTWQAQVKHLGGLLKAVPQGLIRAAAEKVIAEAWAAVEAKAGTAGA